MLAAQLCHWQFRSRFSQEAKDRFFYQFLLHVQPPVFGIGLQSQVLLKSSEAVSICFVQQRLFTEFIFFLLKSRSRWFFVIIPDSDLGGSRVGVALKKQCVSSFEK